MLADGTVLKGAERSPRWLGTARALCVKDAAHPEGPEAEAPSRAAPAHAGPAERGGQRLAPPAARLSAVGGQDGARSKAAEGKDRD